MDSGRTVRILLLLTTTVNHIILKFHFFFENMLSPSMNFIKRKKKIHELCNHV
jgi:hypothetical protein